MSGVDTCLGELHKFGLSHLHGLVAEQRKVVDVTLTKLLDEARAELRNHAIRSLMPKASAQKSCQAMIEEVKNLMEKVRRDVTGCCLDQMQEGVERYTNNFNVEGRSVLTDFLQAAEDKRDAKHGRSNDKAEKKIESIRKAAGAEVNTRVKHMVAEAMADYAKTVDRLNAKVAEQAEELENLGVRCEVAEDTLREAKEKRDERIQLLLDESDILKRDLRISQSHFESQQRRMKKELETAEAAVNQALRRRTGQAEEGDAKPAEMHWLERGPNPSVATQTDRDASTTPKSTPRASSSPPPPGSPAAMTLQMEGNNTYQGRGHLVSVIVYNYGVCSLGAMLMYCPCGECRSSGKGGSGELATNDRHADPSE